MNPFQALVAHWMKKIQQGVEFKRKEFQADADECYRFFDSTYEFLYNLKQMRQGFVWQGGEDEMPKPSFAMTLNKVAELVQLFGPVLYHRNPVRTVTPRMVPDVPLPLFQALSMQGQAGPGLPGGMPGPGANPQQPDPLQLQAQFLQQQVLQSHAVDEARAQVLQHYLNWTPEALDLKSEMRTAIDEALIKGMGVLWTQPYTPPAGTGQLVGSFWDSIDNLVLDPDPKLLRECQWAARRRVAPVWQVEQRFGFQRGALKGHYESTDMQAAIATDLDGEYHRARGKTNDLLVYWEIYSKMGLGSRLSGADPALRDALDSYGSFVYLCVADTHPMPLNIPQQLVDAGDVQGVQLATRWPTPYWADDDWPFQPIIFHERPNKLWPMSHMKPALGELKFLNWAYSFMASKIKTTSRDFIAMKKSLAEELKTTILHGNDLELLEIDQQHGTIAEAVQFLQHPTFNGDIWKVIEAVEANFEKRVGLTELLYGQTGSQPQIRSAQEANIKANQIQVRPDDMAMKIEEAAAGMCRKEALCCRWHLVGQDVAAVLGPAGQQVWDMLITASDPSELLFGLEYRIEQGSARKPNKGTQVASMSLAIQTLFAPLWQYAQATGNTGPVNALISQWADANDFDASAFLIPAAPPPPPAGAGQEAPPPAAGQPPAAKPKGPPS